VRACASTDELALRPFKRNLFSCTQAPDSKEKNNTTGGSNLYWKVYAAGVVCALVSLAFSGCLFYTCQVRLSPLPRALPSSFPLSCAWFLSRCSSCITCSPGFPTSVSLSRRGATLRGASFWEPSGRSGSVKLRASRLLKNAFLSLFCQSSLPRCVCVCVLCVVCVCTWVCVCVCVQRWTQILPLMPPPAALG
jgi:hypothetical protein